MNPPGYPTASAPLQERPYDGFSGQPEGPRMVQYTTVNVMTEQPKDHIIWSIFNLFYMNPFCLGLAALVHSVKARDRKMAGDLVGARHHGTTARSLNIAATVLACLIFLILIIAYSVILALISHAYSSYSSYNSGSSYNYNYNHRW